LRSRFSGLDIIKTWIDRHHHRLHRERAVTGKIFQALPNFCPHRQTPLLLLYIRYKVMKVKKYTGLKRSSALRE
jgi:hypothetical protein